MGSIDINIQLSSVNFLFNIVGAFLILFLANTMYEVKSNIKKVLSTVIILAVLSTITVKFSIELEKYIESIKYIRPFIMLTIKIIAVKYLINISIKQSAVICAFNSLFLAFGEICVYTLLEIHNYDMKNAMNEIKLYSVCNAIIYAIAFILVFLGKGLNLVSKLPRNIKPKAYKYIILNIAISIVIIYPHVEETIFNIKSVFLTVLFLIAILGSLAMDIFSINNIANSEIKEQELEMQKFYNNSMSEIIDRLRMYKHDTGNMINTINGYIRLQRFDKLTEYMSEISSEILKTDNLMAIKNINNAALYGIIYSKIVRAAENGIQMQVIIMGEVNEIQNIKISSLCEVLGIYLDNAIEACMESSKKSMSLTITDSDDSTSILIENSFNEEKLKIEKLGQEGYSTKGENRGTGLYIVRKLLSKNSKVNFKTSIEYGYFKQKLRIEKSL